MQNKRKNTQQPFIETTFYNLENLCIYDDTIWNQIKTKKQTSLILIKFCCPVSLYYFVFNSIVFRTSENIEEQSGINSQQQQ
jgi:hypothetical protein